jgi:uncharacterized protein
MRIEEESVMHTPFNEHIAIIGLSDDPERYAHKALRMLKAKGYKNIVGVHPKAESVEGTPVMSKLQDIKEPIHTVTLYIGPPKSQLQQEAILALKPKRIIFNPGTENPSLMRAAEEQGIEALEACTLVLLSTQQF